MMLRTDGRVSIFRKAMGEEYPADGPFCPVKWGKRGKAQRASRYWYVTTITPEVLEQELSLTAKVTVIDPAGLIAVVMSADVNGRYGRYALLYAGNTTTFLGIYPDVPVEFARSVARGAAST